MTKWVVWAGDWVVGTFDTKAAALDAVAKVTAVVGKGAKLVAVTT